MTAETAMVLPVLVAVVLGLVWLLGVGVAQVRAVDAARETARAAARGDAVGSAAALGRSIAPARATVRVTVGPDTTRAAVMATVHGPGGVFAFLPGVTVAATAVAATEQGAS